MIFTGLSVLLFLPLPALADGFTYTEKPLETQYYPVSARTFEEAKRVTLKRDLALEGDASPGNAVGLCRSQTSYSYRLSLHQAANGGEYEIGLSSLDCTVQNTIFLPQLERNFPNPQDQIRWNSYAKDIRYHEGIHYDFNTHPWVKHKLQAIYDDWQPIRFQVEAGMTDIPAPIKEQIKNALKDRLDAVVRMVRDINAEFDREFGEVDKNGKDFTRNFNRRALLERFYR